MFHRRRNGLEGIWKCISQSVVFREGDKKKIHFEMIMQIRTAQQIPGESTLCFRLSENKWKLYISYFVICFVFISIQCKTIWVKGTQLFALYQSIAMGTVIESAQYKTHFYRHGLAAYPFFLLYASYVVMRHFSDSHLQPKVFPWLLSLVPFPCNSVQVLPRILPHILDVWLLSIWCYIGRTIYVNRSHANRPFVFLPTATE